MHDDKPGGFEQSKRYENDQAICHYSGMVREDEERKPAVHLKNKDGNNQQK